MAIVRWDPFRDFGFTAPSTTWMPPVDIYQTGDHELVLKAELPDMTREDIDINIENFVLTIKGAKKLAEDVKEEQFHHVERRYGTFTRSFSLPQTVDPSRVSAVPERRADREAAASRRGQAAVDQGRSGGVRTGQGLGQDQQDRRIARAGGMGRMGRSLGTGLYIRPVPPFQPVVSAC